jgi:RND family efflux transporter MFP subunit
MAVIEQEAEAAPGAEGEASVVRLAAPEPQGGAVGAEQAFAFADVSAWTRLSSADSLEAFAAAWLELQSRLIGNIRTAVVLLGPNEHRTFSPLAYWPESSDGNPALAAVAELSLEQRRGAVRQRLSSPGHDRLDALAYPLVIGQDLRGVVAIEVPHESEARLRVVMRLLQWGCAWWHTRVARPASQTQELASVLDLLATGLQEERFVGAATAVVTELANHLCCERVSFGTRKGRHTRVRALSHTANFNRKSGLIRALGATMDEAIDQQEVLILPSGEEAVPLITHASAELMNQHGSKAVCTVPLSDCGRLIGALTLERGSEQPFSAEEVALCRHAGILLGPILEAKRREDRWIWAKVGDSARGFAANLFGPGHLVLKTAALALTAMVLFFSLATGEYRVTAPATLEGTVQRAITAPQDGYIAGAEVRPGDLVAAQQSLAALEDTDLRLEKVRWEGEREKLQREYSRSLAERDRAQVRILGAQIEQAEARIALLAEQLARTRITAPFDGVIVSGDLSQSLGAPVSRGDVLFEIAPLDSYRVNIRVDERDISQLSEGQAGRLALAGLAGEPLAIRVEKITPVAEAEEGKNLFRVEGALLDASDALRPGMSGVAKIAVDERNLFWIWTHKLAYWLRLWWWSWWP